MSQEKYQLNLSEKHLLMIFIHDIFRGPFSEKLVQFGSQNNLAEEDKQKVTVFFFIWS